MTPAPAAPRAARAGLVPFDRYPGLPELFTRFLGGGSEFYPDPPTPEAAAQRARELLRYGLPTALMTRRGAPSSTG